MKIADIIELAINEHLWEGKADYRTIMKNIFSCPAIKKACKNNYFTTRKIEKFLTPMGVQCRGIAEQFRGIPEGPKRQYARALWLTWAAMIAREEGI